VPDPDISVMVVDDQAPFRAAARAVIERTDGFRWAGDAESAEQALALLVERAPAMVVMDVHLGPVDGIEATRRILAAEPSTVVLLCSGHDRSDLPDGARTSGAAAYVDKADLSGAVLRAVWEGHTGWDGSPVVG
jgi:two-component system, NarL family, invasion response regulator UvrY